MSAIATMSRPGVTPAMRLMSRLASVVPEYIKRIVRAYQNRHDAAVLATMDDRSLADMGLTRNDVHHALSAPLWEDPTIRLRARALERRLNQNRVSLGLRDSPIEAPPLAPREQFIRPPVDRPARFII